LFSALLAIEKTVVLDDDTTILVVELGSKGSAGTKAKVTLQIEFDIEPKDRYASPANPSMENH